MTRSDLKVLCTALGFTAIVMKDSDIPSPKDCAFRAQRLGQLIEEFCLTTIPEAIQPDDG